MSSRPQVQKSALQYRNGYLDKTAVMRDVADKIVPFLKEWGIPLGSTAAGGILGALLSKKGRARNALLGALLSGSMGTLLKAVTENIRAKDAERRFELSEQYRLEDAAKAKERIEKLEAVKKAFENRSNVPALSISEEDIGAGDSLPSLDYLDNISLPPPPVTSP